MKNKILVSACLMGFKVRYNGTEKARLNTVLEQWQQEQRLVIHCPELAAGLPTPRASAEIAGFNGDQVMQNSAKVIESTGNDVTAHYQLAAWLALRTALDSNCIVALFTDKSPTCGSQYIYDGNFSGVIKQGEGVATALLRQHGIKVFSENQLEELIGWVENWDKENAIL
ncbi:DUF523 domain-containing protein [Proteus alimentorum]|uniref:DUF523 domain-containing protein n=1 Tax=Proteus alimentorum TaxID=1973495 RepID=A0ABS0IXZ9_9GAMM|nr:DUF523 domain-containing protein [Proteus alimentorum]MBG2876565.1 DUF523 domain-containing protein [Proteus alimentorum]MBG2880904.1 DUF523 domain-containing protein [Proteus alimentorum]